MPDEEYHSTQNKKQIIFFKTQPGVVRVFLTFLTIVLYLFGKMKFLTESVVLNFHLIVTCYKRLLDICIYRSTSCYNEVWPVSRSTQHPGFVHLIHVRINKRHPNKILK